MSAPASAPAPVWRDEDRGVFDATVLAAAEALGVQPLAVEKDYWVCRALRAITVGFRDQVIFKGGTSLEKLRLIHRFSEDLDLLVVGEYDTDRSARRALKEMCRVAAVAVGADEVDAKSGGVTGAFHRRAYLTPPLAHDVAPGTAVADPRTVLLELGQSGGRHPSRPRPVTSLLSRN